MSCDPYWDQTVLACHFDGANGSTAFIDEKGHALTVYGDAQLTTSSPKFGTACATFDGTGDYVTITDSVDLELGNLDFCIEFWMKTTQTLSYACPLGRDNGGFPSGAWAVLLNGPASGWIQFWNASYSGGSANLSPATNPVVNDGNWHHIAIVRYGSSMALYVDGTSRAASVWAGVIADVALDINIGRHPGYSRDFNGQIDDLRITRGAARYTENFTPPATAFATNQCAISGTVDDAGPAERLVRVLRRDNAAVLNIGSSVGGVFDLPVAYEGECMVICNDASAAPDASADVILALKMADFTDDKGHTVTANGDVSVIPSAFLYSRSAAYFDGSNDYLACTYSADYEVGSGDFTYECWFKVPNVSGQKTLFAFHTDFHIGVFLNGAKMACFASTNGASWDLISADSGPLNGAGNIDVTANVWHHFAWVRSGTTWTMWLDGVIDRQLTGLSGTVFSRNETLNIGRWGNAGYWMSGYIKDFRFTKNARYTASFNPPFPDFLSQPSGGAENALIFDRVIPT